MANFPGKFKWWQTFNVPYYTLMWRMFSFQLQNFLWQTYSININIENIFISAAISKKGLKRLKWDKSQLSVCSFLYLVDNNLNIPNRISILSLTSLDKETLARYRYYILLFIIINKHNWFGYCFTIQLKRWEHRGPIT